MRFDKTIKKLLKEYTSPWPDYSGPELMFDDIPKSSIKIKDTVLSGTKYSIYLYKIDFSSLECLYVVGEDGRVELNVWYSKTPDNQIVITEVSKRKDSKFYYSEFFKKEMLTTYDYVISDIHHTQASFNFYMRLADDPEVNVIVIDSDSNKNYNFNIKEEIPVSSGQELKKYYGKGMENFRYKVSLHK